MLNRVLLTGPYDWEPEIVPRAEYEYRLAAVRTVMAREGASALLVHGHTGEHGALAWLTGFTPKIGRAFALVPLDGPLAIMNAGTAAMAVAAAHLTWVEDVRGLANAPRTISDWLTGLAPGGTAVLGLWGGATMPYRIFEAISAAMRPVARIADLEEPLDALRRRKSALEHDVMRRAGKVLDATVAACRDAASGGAGARSCALAAERAAFAAGAQDVRILASARPGGMPLPLDCDEDPVCDPLLAVVAARYAGYWAEGLVTVAVAPGGAASHADAALDAMVKAVRPGLSAADLARAASGPLAPYQPHPLTRGTVGNGIGLSLSEAPILTAASAERLEEGGIYTLRTGAAGEGSDNAIASAMIAVGRDGPEILWRGQRYNK